MIVKSASCSLRHQVAHTPFRLLTSLPSTSHSRHANPADGTLPQNAALIVGQDAHDDVALGIVLN